MKKYTGPLIVGGLWLGVVILWLNFNGLSGPLFIFIVLLNLCMFSGFFIWTRVFNVSPEGTEIARWKGFKRKSSLEVTKETAQESLRQGDFNIAENQFRPLLEKHPDDPDARLGLAKSLFGQADRGLRKDPQKKAEALEQYRWVLEYDLKNGKHQEALELYRKILGPYSAEEIGQRFKTLVSGAAEAMGTMAVHDGHDLHLLKKKLHAEFDDFANRGKFPQAQAVLEEILKCEDVHGMEAVFLCRLGEVCQRVGGQKTTEDIYEEIAKRGDGRQTAKALAVLARYWLNTPKQLQLAHLYKASAERFATLDDSPEWVELGRKLGL